MLPFGWKLLVAFAASWDRLTTLYEAEGCPVDAGVLAEHDDDGVVRCVIECSPDFYLGPEPIAGFEDCEIPYVAEFQLKRDWLRKALSFRDGRFRAIASRGADDQVHVLVLRDGLVEAIVETSEFHVFVPCGPLRLMAGGVETPVYQPRGHANSEARGTAADQQEAA